MEGTADGLPLAKASCLACRRRSAAWAAEPVWQLPAASTPPTSLASRGHLGEAEVRHAVHVLDLASGCRHGSGLSALSPKPLLLAESPSACRSLPGDKRFPSLPSLQLLHETSRLRTAS